MPPWHHGSWLKPTRRRSCTTSPCRDDWDEAQRTGADYRRSTIGRSLEDEGFIHTSFAHQVQATADAFYRGRDVVLLVIDPALVPGELRVEEIGDGRAFPHLYGPIPLGAVVTATPVPVAGDGRLDVSSAVTGRPTPGTG